MEDQTTRLPLRVLVKGASNLIYVRPMGGPRSELAVSRGIEAELYAAGWPAEVRCTAEVAAYTSDALRTWVEDVWLWSPDVIVYSYAGMEQVYLFLPRWLERYVHTLKTRQQPLRQLYRRVVLERLWGALVKAEAAVDRRYPLALTKWKNQRIRRDLKHLIRQVRWIQSPLVLLPEFPTGTPAFLQLFPGFDARIALINELVQDVVREADDPDVRFVPIFTEHLAPIRAAGREVVPDGVHHSAEANRVFAEVLADIIVDWAEKQEHLVLPDKRRRT
jgi:hypothetical protein